MVTIDGEEIVSGSTIDGDEISVITMDGDVVWNALPDAPFLQPQENDLSHFEDTGSYRIENSPTITEDYVLTNDSRNTYTYSVSGLDHYPKIGDKWEFYWKEEYTSGSGGHLGMHFAVQEDDPSKNYFAGHAPTDNDEIIAKDTGPIYSDDVIIESTSQSISNGDWYLCEITWAENGDIRVREYNVNQSTGERRDKIVELVTNDSTYSDGGIGFSREDTSTEPARQGFRIIERGISSID